MCWPTIDQAPCCYVTSLRTIIRQTNFQMSVERIRIIIIVIDSYPVLFIHLVYSRLQGKRTFGICLRPLKTITTRQTNFQLPEERLRIIIVINSYPALYSFSIQSITSKTNFWYLSKTSKNYYNKTDKLSDASRKASFLSLGMNN